MFRVVLLLIFNYHTDVFNLFDIKDTSIAARECHFFKDMKKDSQHETVKHCNYTFSSFTIS